MTTAAATRSWQILHGDCLEVLPTLEPGTARLIFADPPYNQGMDYGEGRDADCLDDGEYFEWCQDWIRACVPVLTDDGSMWVMAPHKWQAYIFLALADTGLHHRDTITWYEAFGVYCARKFGLTSRFIHHFTRHRTKFVFNADAIRVPSTRQLQLYPDKRANPAGKVPPDVWDIPRVCDNHPERIPGFPTQLPLGVLRRVVRCASNPGDLVLDPFSGSATTGVAALEAGRRYIGIEKSSRYSELSASRLADAFISAGVLPAHSGKNTK